MGWVIDPVGHAQNVAFLKEDVRTLEAHLKDKEFLVGNRFTLADLACWSLLVMGFGLVLDAEFRKDVPHVTAWFEKISKRPEVTKVAGHVKLVEKALAPATA